MSDAIDFPAYARLADQLIERATKEQLADVARLLALNIGWYQQKYGDVPQETLLKMVQGRDPGRRHPRAPLVWHAESHLRARRSHRTDR